MEDNFKDYFTGSKELLTDYLEARWKLIRLDTAGKVANALGVFLGLLIAAMLGFFVIMFLGFLLAYWISDISGSFTLGFSVTAIVFLLLFIIILIFRKRLIHRPLANALIRELAEGIEDQETENT
jgi:hypothetical protein